MLFMLHIITGIVSVILGVGALTQRSATLLKVQLATFAGTILTGVGLVIINPASMLHLCVSGTVFSAITIALMIATKRQLSLVDSKA